PVKFPNRFELNQTKQFSNSLLEGPEPNLIFQPRPTPTPSDQRYVYPGEGDVFRQADDGWKKLP
ncbi:MAG: hypothetical protein PVI90_12160, partial [Desulfobacteraceae bacterium]